MLSTHQLALCLLISWLYTNLLAGSVLIHLQMCPSACSFLTRAGGVEGRHIGVYGAAECLAQRFVCRGARLRNKGIDVIE